MHVASSSIPRSMPTATAEDDRKRTERHIAPRPFRRLPSDSILGARRFAVGVRRKVVSKIALLEACGQYVASLHSSMRKWKIECMHTRLAMHRPCHPRLRECLHIPTIGRHYSYGILVMASHRYDWFLSVCPSIHRSIDRSTHPSIH